MHVCVCVRGVLLLVCVCMHVHEDYYLCGVCVHGRVYFCLYFVLCMYLYMVSFCSCYGLLLHIYNYLCVFLYSTSVQLFPNIIT